MPFISLKTWPVLSKETKQKLVWGITDITTRHLNIPPDKIQILIQEVPSENWGKAGAVPFESEFNKQSRIINWETNESYYDGSPDEDESMCIINIDVWNMYTQAEKDEWTNLLTNLITKHLNIKKDNILIIYRDMPPGNWGQSGVNGNNKEFLEKSRLNIKIKNN